MSNLETRLKILENRILSLTSSKTIFGDFESTIISDIAGGDLIEFTSYLSSGSVRLTTTLDSKGINIPKTGYYSILYKINLSTAEGGSGSTFFLNVNSVNVIDSSLRSEIPSFGIRNKVILLHEGDILGISNNTGIVTLNNVYEPGCQLFINFLTHI